MGMTFTVVEKSIGTGIQLKDLPLTKKPVAYKNEVNSSQNKVTNKNKNFVQI
jgi:hypothetical protein